MNVDGANGAQIKGAGFWRGMGLRAYSDTRLSGDLEISLLAATASPSDIDDGPGAPANVAFAESLRKRARPFPARELVYGGPLILTAGTGFRGRSISRGELSVLEDEKRLPTRRTPRVDMPTGPLTDFGSGAWEDGYQ